MLADMTHSTPPRSETWPSTQKASGRDIIVIVRHGKPALSRKVRLNWLEYREWWKQYDLSGLADGQMVPKKLSRLMQSADAVYSSDLKRAVETATMAAGRAPDVIDSQFREAALPSPWLGKIKLRPKSWGTLSRIVWFYGLVNSEERVTPARMRAKAMALRLESDASGERMIVVFAHGWFNRMMGTQLRRRGWKITKNQGDLHWKFRRYERTSQG